MKNITLRADERLIEAAPECAGAEHSTLNEQFRRWLAAYARPARGGATRKRWPYLIDELRGRSGGGRKFTREEMNER